MSSEDDPFASAPPAAPSRQTPDKTNPEQYLLGACLIDGTANPLSGLHADDFTDPRNRIIRDTIIEFGADISVIATELQTSGRLDAAGGAIYLSSLGRTAPTTAYVAYFKSKIREASSLRALQAAALQISSAPTELNGDGAEFVQELIESLRAAADLAQTKLAKNPRGLSPEIVTARSIDGKSLRPPPEIIADVLYQGGKLMMSAPSKARKTYLLAALAICVSAGRPWLGLETAKGNVLYLNFELQEFAFRDRIRAICLAYGVEIPESLHVWNLRGTRANLPRIRKKLVKFCQDHAITLIIFDPIYKLLDGLSENDAGEIAGLLNDVEAIAHETSAAVAWAHHFAKGSAMAKESIDRASGSGVWARDPDAVMTLTPNSADDCLGVECHLRNFKPIEPFAIRWRYPIWVTDERIDPLDHKRVPGQPGPVRKSPDVVMGHVPSTGTIDRGSLIETVCRTEGVKERTVVTMLSDLVDRGELHKWIQKRPGMRDAVAFGRTPQPPAELGL